MSKVFNMVGGGGGKNISSIIITGLESTETVTCTKGGRSYTATWDETAQHWEIVGLPLGTFTLTATNGTKTKTETVLIDIAGVYEIEIMFKLWLYRDGDSCENVTGGWGTSGYSLNSTLQAPVVNDKSVTLYTNANNYASFIGTNNPISFAGYSKLKCCTKNVSISGTYAGGTIHFDAQKTSIASTGQYISFVRSSDESECEIDISDFQDIYYIVASVFNEVASAELTKVWLE